MKIAIIGKGHAGTALAEGLGRNHEIKFGHRDPNESAEDAAKWGELIILAVPFAEVNNAVKEIDLYAEGKVVVDVTNVVGENMEWAVGFTTSGAEELQKKLPNSKIVKAFNTVFAKNMPTGRVDGEQLSAFVASDDDNAREIVMRLSQEIGFEPVDCGPLKSSRYLEAMGVFIIDLAFNRNMGSHMGLKLLRPV